MSGITNVDCWNYYSGTKWNPESFNAIMLLTYVTKSTGFHAGASVIELKTLTHLLCNKTETMYEQKVSDILLVKLETGKHDFLC